MVLTSSLRGMSFLLLGGAFLLLHLEETPVCANTPPTLDETLIPGGDGQLHVREQFPTGSFLNNLNLALYIVDPDAGQQVTFSYGCCLDEFGNPVVSVAPAGNLLMVQETDYENPDETRRTFTCKAQLAVARLRVHLNTARRLQLP